MSDKITVDGRNKWSYPRMRDTVWKKCALFGLVLVVSFIVVAAEAAGLWPFLVPALLFFGWAIYGIGSSEIVFDDNSEMIYLLHKRCFHQRVSVHNMGPYSTFRECILQEVRSGSGSGSGDHRVQRMTYKIQFLFSDGVRDDGKTIWPWIENTNLHQGPTVKFSILYDVLCRLQISSTFVKYC